MYVFKTFGKSMKRLINFTSRFRCDLILLDTSIDEPKLLRNFHIENNVNATIRKNIIRDNWNSFWERGVSRPMFDFELYIDTNNSPPDCCRQLMYGFH